jgi:hypothetical protein
MHTVPVIFCIDENDVPYSMKIFINNCIKNCSSKLNLYFDQCCILDYGFTSGGYSDMTSSGSDDCEKSAPWMVKVSDFSGEFSILREKDREK